MSSDVEASHGRRARKATDTIRERWAGAIINLVGKGQMAGAQDLSRLLG